MLAKIFKYLSGYRFKNNFVGSKLYMYIEIAKMLKSLHQA